MQKYTVTFYLKGKRKDWRRFDTLPEAQAFMLALSLCDCCESYGLERIRDK